MGRKKSTPKTPKNENTVDANTSEPASSNWGWNTTDDDEVQRRQERAVSEPMKVVLAGGIHRFYGNYSIISEETGRTYRVEIRSLLNRENTCECQDFQVNRLGTCKHIERTLLFLRRSKYKTFLEAAHEGTPYVEVFLDRRAHPAQICVRWPKETSPALKRRINALFSADGTLLAPPEEGIPSLKRIFDQAPNWREKVRISYQIDPMVEHLQSRRNRATARTEFLKDVDDEKRSLQVLQHPLYDYQIEGMLHLAFNERALLADDMGLGKTAQAIAACEILRQTRGIKKVAIVCPSSLKGEWDEQIRKFSGHPTVAVFGQHEERLRDYQRPGFYHILNYEQVRSDFDAINDELCPDVVILDEAQRIKNWQTKTAQAAKRLKSTYAFVLTGTPMENRIDELYSIVDFLDPEIFGPLFRFNREFYQFDERGRPSGYKNLQELRSRVGTVMMRRKKSDVEDQLPGRTINNYFVTMAQEQRTRYESLNQKVAALSHLSSQRTLRKDERDSLQRMLSSMRMLCDTPYILDPESKACPKVDELRKLLDEIQAAHPTAKIVIFSEWLKMLELTGDLVQQLGLGHAWHTGEIPQKARQEELARFKESDECRVLLSTDSGGVGLNLQAASIVINLDLPWNPTRLEQRIARVWRKGQSQTVSVINLICSDSIEERMLTVMDSKRELSEGVLDGEGDLSNLTMPSGHQAFIGRLQSVLGVDPGDAAPRAEAPAPNRIKSFKQDLLARFPNRVLHLEMHKSSTGSDRVMLVVDEDSASLRTHIETLFRQTWPKGSGADIQIMGRNEYQALSRLHEDGWISLNCQPQVIHTSDILRLPSPNAHQHHAEVVLARARELMGQATRNRKMAEVLSKGGFPQEALSPIRASLELALQSLVALTEEVDLTQDEIPMEQLRAVLFTRGWVTEGFLEAVNRLRIDTSQSLSEKESRRTLKALKDLMTTAEQLLNERALS